MVRGDPDHGPDRVGQRHPRHAERDRGLVGPPGQLSVQLGAQVQGDPDRLVAYGRAQEAECSLGSKLGQGIGQKAR